MGNYSTVAAAKVHTHTKANITDFPTSMPASDVSAWAKAATKPAYTPAEVGAAPAVHNHDSAYLGKTAKATDSDLLDGNHASAFAAASHEHGRITYVGVDSNVVSAAQTSSTYYGSAADWASYIICNHGNGANYYHQMLRLPFGGGLQSQVMQGGNLSGWRTYLDNANFINYVYPVGSIYMSISSTSPATLFGGTWSAISSGYVLRTGTGGATGGSDTHAHTTTAVALTVAQLPAHNHRAKSPTTGTAGGVKSGFDTWRTGGDFSGDYMIENTGSGSAHGHGNTGSASNIPVYYSVYAWRRTA